MLTGLGASLGLGSGINMNSMVEQLMKLESQPLVRLQKQQAQETAKLSAYGQVKSALADFRSALSGLIKPAGKTVDIYKATPAEGAPFTASVSQGATLANYQIAVKQLATSHRVVTKAGDAAPQIAEGDSASKLTIEVGKVVHGDSGDSFSAKEVKIIDFKGKSLEELRDTINNSKAGVRASIINNGTSKQLVFTSEIEGEEGAFRISGEDRLSGFRYSPVANAGDDYNNGAFTEMEKAQGAVAVIDGIEVTSKNNKIEDAIEGVKLTLTKESEKKAGTGNTTATGSEPQYVTSSLSVTRSNGDISAELNKMIDAYYKVNDLINQFTAYDPNAATGEKASLLTGDSAMRSIQREMENALFGNFDGGSSGVTSLAQLGIFHVPMKDGKANLDKDAKMSVDAGALTSALNNKKFDLVKFFTGSEEVKDADGNIITPATKGFGEQLAAKIDAMLDTDKGTVGRASRDVQDSLKTMETESTRLEEKLQAAQDRYISQFASLDSLLAGMKQTSSDLMAQLASLPKLN